MFNRGLPLISYPLSVLSFVLLCSKKKKKNHYFFCNSDVLLKSAAGTFITVENL